MEFTTQELNKDIDYLQMLTKQFPDIDSVCSEIINLQAILNLPKGTEHFLTDIHGEYEAFSHVLRNASGVIKRKIHETFSESLTLDEKKDLATLVYYPKERIKIMKKSGCDMKVWYMHNIHRLVSLCRTASSKYTRSKIRKSLPDNFAYIIEELLHEKESEDHKHDYYNEIVESIIDVQRADRFIKELCKVIRRLVVDRLHIIGDIYDRGPGAHIIMDDLMDHHSLDIQWGNHDILWMGAAAGSQACIANALRISLRYANLETIEDGYGINLLPLARLAVAHYRDKDIAIFKPKLTKDDPLSESDIELISMMHKTIAVIQFKLEGQTIMRNKDFRMSHRLFLDGFSENFEWITIDGKKYAMKDSDFPTIDINDPYALTLDERELMMKLQSSFENSDKLQKHVRFLYTKGSLYLKFNSNLLYHSCVPLDENNEFLIFEYDNVSYSGKTLLDFFDKQARAGYFEKSKRKKQNGLDFMWYMWCGQASPLFGKSKMATFERYFIADKDCHIEHKNNYFHLRDDEALAIKILEEFKLDTNKSHIVSGHVPVKASRGESPLKANGKMLVIDGGFSKAYHNETGIAGYTLIHNSRGLLLVSHEPFDTLEDAIKEQKDNLPTIVVNKALDKRILVKDTEIGQTLSANIVTLKKLLSAYRTGLLK